MRQSGIAIIGAPMDLGAGRRGVDMGPSALRLAGLDERLVSMGYRVKDQGNVSIAQPETAQVGHESARFLPEIAQTCAGLAQMVYEAISTGNLPLVLGGDHSVAIGTVAGISHAYRDRGEKIGLIWIDAHADMNTPQTSPSGNIHGMPLACCMGDGPDELTDIFGFHPKVEPRNVAILGLRDVDRREARHVSETGVSAYTMRDIDERGLRAVMADAIRVAGDGTAGIHISFDMDAVDPSEAPGVGTPVRGGLTYREAHLAMEILCDCDNFAGMEIVEVNPVLDTANQTAKLGVELVLSALGKKIL